MQFILSRDEIMPMLEYSELRAFNAVAKYLNFSKASEELGLSSPQVSKIISALEAKIKCKLLNRTTRNVALTNEGLAFRTVSLKALDMLTETSQLFVDQEKPQDMVGQIRLTAPNTYGVRYLAEPLREFAEKCPKVQVQVRLDDQYLDFIADGIDLAIRIMKPVDSSLVARKISANPISFYASPNYIKKNVLPKTVSDLSQHNVFCTQAHFKMRFKKSGIKMEDAIGHTPIICSNGDLFFDFAYEGMGILARSEWGVAKEVKAGLLIKIDLDDEIDSDSEVYLVYPKHQFTAPRIKILIDILLKNLPK